MSAQTFDRHLPLWCESTHAPDAPVESRYHEQLLGEFVAVIGYQPDLENEPDGHVDELIVRRVRYFNSANHWIIIERAEHASTNLMLQEDAAIQLGEALMGLSRELG